MKGLLYPMNNLYYVFHELESGGGYIDTILIPKPILGNNTAIILEYKHEEVKNVDTLAKHAKKGLEQMEKEGFKAVLMGQRRSDPYGADLEHFSPCSKGWPQIVRVNPILDWSYSTIWGFLRGCGLEYCKLYDEGYTSLGSKASTKKNPKLLSETGHSRPAHELQGGDIYERVSRDSEQIAADAEAVLAATAAAASVATTAPATTGENSSI